eukprot:jgi/Ulvmu1/10119/UM006_0071.1
MAVRWWQRVPRGRCAGLLPAAVISTKPALTYVAQETIVHGFLTGLRPGTSLHLFFAPGGCNISVVTDVIVPDFLPPTFVDVERLDALAAIAVASSALQVDNCRTVLF